MLDIEDNLSIISLNDDDTDSDSRIHTWLAHQCSLPLTALEDEQSEPCIPSSMSQQSGIRADSPLLGFPSMSDVSEGGHASPDPLHFPSPTYKRDLPASERVTRPDSPLERFIRSEEKPLPVLPTSTSRTPTPPAEISNFVPLPPSFTRLSYHPRPQQSPSHSRNGSTSTGRVSLSRSLSTTGSAIYPIRALNTHTHSPTHSLVRQPSLPLLGETSVLALEPRTPPVSPKLFPMTFAYPRSRSQSNASLGMGAYNLVPGPSVPKATPMRRQSVHPLVLHPTASQVPVPFSSSLSSSRPGTAHGSESDQSVRNAVYLDSEEISAKLYQLLKMQGDCEDLERDLEEEFCLSYTTQDDAPSGSTEDRELLTPTPERYAPPNTPLPGAHTFPSSAPSLASRSFASSSQVSRTSPPTSRPSTTESSIYPKSLHFQPFSTLPSLPNTPSEEGTDLGSPMFPRTYQSDIEADTPGTSPAMSAKELYLNLHGTLSLTQSQWSLDSNVVDLGKSVLSVETEPPKAGKRQRLASFISRFSVLPAPHSTVANVVPGTWTSQPSTAPPAEDNADGDSPTPTRTPVFGKPASLKINTAFQPTRATHTPSTSTSTFVSAESAFSQASSATSVSTGSSSSPSHFKPVLPSMSTPALFPLPPGYPPISPATLGLDADPFACHQPVRMSKALSPLGSPAAAKSLEHVPSTVPLFLASPIDAKSPVYPGDVSTSTPLTPSKKKLRQTMNRASLGLGLKGLIGRVWERERDDVDAVPPTPTKAWRRPSDGRKPPTSEDSEWRDFEDELDIPTLETSQAVGVRMGIARMSGVRLGMNRYRGVTLPSAMTGSGKRKLVISGVSDAKGFEAVKAWCEGFGEVRDIQRKNGALYVDFKKASVADTVCRVQAQVSIKGAGSVSLSWCTSSKK